MKTITTKSTALFLVLSLCLMCFPVSAAPATPTIAAEAAIVMEATTGRVLYNKNADDMMVPASMTKVMTAYIVFEELYAGNLTPDTQIPITQRHADLSTNSNYPANVPLVANSTVSVDMLLKLILLPSASASCIVMADYISGSEEAFVQRMNETADRLSIQAEYENCHGAFPHYLTARGQARLIQVFLQQFPEILDYTSLTAVEFNGKSYPNTNHLLSTYYYPGVDGFKTGTIAESGYCLCATAQKDGVRLITVVLKSSNNETRHTDSIKLLDYGFALMDESPQYFQDSGRHPESAKAYETLRSHNVHLQSINGWVRPQEVMTRGEFAITLISALEKTGAITTLKTQPNSLPNVVDLQNYTDKEIIFRGLHAGLLPWTGTYFSPQVPLTQEAMSDALTLVADRLGAEYQAPPYIPYHLIQSATLFSLALPFPTAAAAASLQANNPEEANSTQQVLRGDATIQIAKLLTYIT